MKYNENNLYYLQNFRGLEKSEVYLTLKTFLGYLPIENIESYKDIFFGDYFGERVDAIYPYRSLFADAESRNKVKTLSIRLGKHWKEK